MCYILKNISVDFITLIDHFKYLEYYQTIMLNYYYNCNRAQKRMNGEDVFGNKIYATHAAPIIMRIGCESHRDSPNKSARKYRHEFLEMDEGYQTMASTASWAPMPPMPQFCNQPVDWSISADLKPHLCLKPIQQFCNTIPMCTAYTHEIDANSSASIIPPSCPQAWIDDKMSFNKDDHSNTRSRSTSFSKVDSSGRKCNQGGATDLLADYSSASRTAWYGNNRSVPQNRFDNSNLVRPSSSSSWQQTQMNSSGNSSDTDNYFQPIRKSDATPVELHVTNLDQTIDQSSMREILLALFKEHVNVLSLQVYMQNDGTTSAAVKVPSLQHAQYAISQVHRRRVGCKRILISYANNDTPNPQILKSQVMSLLQTIPGHSLPLFKFRELFEGRYLVSVSLSDLYKMRDVCTITEDAKGRIVSLLPEHRDSPSPQLTGQENEQPFCAIHCKMGVDNCWADNTMSSLPNVFISLKELSINLNKLLKSHAGCVPLPSLAICYEADLGIKLDMNDKTGVPLEHLVSCCTEVYIRQGVSGVKHLVWNINHKDISTSDSSQNEDSSGMNPKCMSPALAHQLIQFSREIVDLLRTTAKCQVLFNKFIPAYHHHFGRQCRVADYGFTKLIDLMDAMSNTVQVMGEGNKRVITLSHRAQIKRFTSDLCRVLKTRMSKQLLLSELPGQFEKILDRPWDITEYGVCLISDILNEVNQNTLVRSSLPNDLLITTPKHEQTVEEIRKTNIFKVEVIELLRHARQYSMQFNKFVPAYHHHFGHQCRVSDYGFTKLIELFEAVPDIVKVTEGSDSERLLSLVPNEAVKVLGEQLEQILSASSHPMPLMLVCSEFIKLYGYALKPELYKCDDIMSLLRKFTHIKAVQSNEGIHVSLEDRVAIHRLGIRAWSVLLNNNKMKIYKFLEKYKKIYSESCDIEKLSEAKAIVNITKPVTIECMISLTPLWEFAARGLLCCERGYITISVFENSYYNLYRKQIDPNEYGFQNLTSLIAAVPEVLLLKERNNRKKYICVNSDLLKSGVCLPPSLPIYNNESSSSISSDSQISTSKKRLNHSSENKRKHTNSRPNSQKTVNQPFGRNEYQIQNNSYFDNSIGCKDFVNPNIHNESLNNWPSSVPNIHKNIGMNEFNKVSCIGSEIGQECISEDMNLLDFLNTPSDSSVGKQISTHRAWQLPNNTPENTSELYKLFLKVPVLPPKPDTPPSQASELWAGSLWEPLVQPSTNFVVNLPPSSEDATVDMDLISPTLSLMSAAPNPFSIFNSPGQIGNNSDKIIQAPPPSELPKPSLNLVAPKKDEKEEAAKSNPSSNSGVKTPTSESKRKGGRIAAIFSSMDPK